MHETGHSKPVHWDSPEGWDGEGGERGSGRGGTCAPMADSGQCCKYSPQYFKGIRLQLK